MRTKTGKLSIVFLNFPTRSSSFAVAPLLYIRQKRTSSSASQPNLIQQESLVVHFCWKFACALVRGKAPFSVGVCCEILHRVAICKAQVGDLVHMETVLTSGGAFPRVDSRLCGWGWPQALQIEVGPRMSQSGRKRHAFSRNRDALGVNRK